MKTASNGMFHFDTYETKLSNTTLAGPNTFLQLTFYHER